MTSNRSNDEILIWGAGAMGGTLGAYLRRAGHRVSFVDVEPAHVAALSDPSRGLQITGPVDQFAIHVPACLPQHVEGEWRRIILAVKGQHTTAACHALAPHLAEDGYVLSVQNGLCERAIAQVVGEKRTMGAFVNYAADWEAPGKIIFGTRGTVSIGELDGSVSPRLQEMLGVLRDFEPNARITRDIWGDLWSKSAFSAMLHAQATVRQSMVECFGRAELLPLWRQLVGEIVSVAGFEGVRLHAFDGFEPYAFGRQAPEDAARQSVARVIEFLRPGAKTHSGIWRDIAVRKRPTGVDVTLGEIIEIGARHSLKCRGLRSLMAMILEIETGDRKQDDNNLLELLRAA